ncbi:metallophosphoesterase [Colwellia sp. E2M01]|uniref:metallophosphoesterase n=1 Tax=Colwellia sp. E2M01 TaxID=2841561 RepID=UPI001C086B64|nr:metallophosphoesterase [Colwellia sp. E2M01]MBU2869668.1 metallophosphoesterase [Colwellia sp. E2M01]
MENMLPHNPLVLAQITDSHLFASLDGLHHGHHVFNNLKKVLLSIVDNPQIHAIIFTGDLTQDHSEQSYQNFVDCVHACGVIIPIYYLAGNHDEPGLLDKYFAQSPFIADKVITTEKWQIQLLDSKSDTPAGLVSGQALTSLQSTIEQDKYQFLLMHHHPIDVGYFIDKHGLQNKADFWQTVHRFNNIKAIACGHVHGAMELSVSVTPGINNSKQAQNTVEHKSLVTVYTCPATSMQFDPNVAGVGVLDDGPAYRIFTLNADGNLHSDVVNC